MIEQPTSNVEITESEALKLLKGLKSAWVAFRLNTDAKLKKGGRLGLAPITEAIDRDPSGYRKISDFVGLVGTCPDLNKLRKNRLEKLDFDFDKWLSFPRRWGKNIDGVEVVNGDNHHVIIHHVTTNKPKVRYEYAGEPIELTDTEKEYLPAPRKPSKRETDAGFTNKTSIGHNEPNINNVVFFVFDKTRYTITH